MTLKNIKNLKHGDEVKWNDPDGGLCSCVIKIRTIKVTGDVVRIVDMDGGYLECLSKELS